MLKKLIAALLCAVMLVSVCAVFTSCGEEVGYRDFDDDEDERDDDDDDDDDKSEGTKKPIFGGVETSVQTKAPEVTQAPENQAPETEPVEIDKTKLPALPSAMVLEKISSTEQKSISYGNHAYAYVKDGKCCIASFDGKINIVTEYKAILAREDYFAIANGTSGKIDPTKLEQVNNQGLCDVNGKTIIPIEYSSITVNDERYLLAYKATKELPTQEGAIVKVTSYDSTDGKEHYFEGEWCVFDMKTGKKVEGVGGTKYPSITVSGNIVSYKNDAGERVKYAPFTTITDKDTVFYDGSFLKDGTVYDPEGKEMFKLKEKGYTPSSISTDHTYYVARKYHDGTSYVVMDKTGKIISAPFTDLIFIRGKLVECKDKIYTFDGQLLSDEFKNFSHDKINGVDIYKGETENEIVVYDGALNVIYRGEKQDYIRFLSLYGAPYKNENKVNTVYCYATKDFTISGSTLGFMLALDNSERGNYKVIDAISGNTVLSGASGVNYVANDDNTDSFIIARTDAGYDFYRVKTK